jgi:hypothetical protein
VVKKTYENYVMDQTEHLWLLSGNLLYVDTLQKVILTINKHIPTSYAKIEVKPGQNGDLVYDMYPYPSDRLNDWDIRRLDPESGLYDGNAYYGVPVQEFDFADVYKLINPENVFDENFKFYFADGAIKDVNGDYIFDKDNVVNGKKDMIVESEIECKTYWNGGEDAPYWLNPSNCGYISTFDLAEDNVDQSTVLWYDLSAIQHDAIDGKKHDVAIAYSYKGISCVKDADGTPLYADVDVRSESKFQYTYKNAFALTFDLPKDTLRYAKDGQKLTTSAIKVKKTTALQTLGFIDANTTISALLNDYKLAYVDGSGTYTCAGKSGADAKEYFMFTANGTVDEVIKAALMNGEDIDMTKVVKTADPNFKDKTVEHKISFKVRNLWNQEATVTLTVPMLTPLHEKY